MTCEHANVNFCEQCEALPIPVHPISHPLAKFKQASPANDRLVSPVLDPRKERTNPVRPPFQPPPTPPRKISPAPPLPPRQESNTRSTITNPSIRSSLIEAPDQCPVCFEDRKGQMIVGASCGHMLCRICQDEFLTVAKASGDKARCYSCRTLYD